MMERYNISISPKASEDMFEAVQYIGVDLHNPKAADNLMDRVDEVINSLELMPERYALASEYWLASRGLRMVSVGNYLLFYTVNKQTHEVAIARFLYGRRDWRKLLRQWLF